MKKAGVLSPANGGGAPRDQSVFEADGSAANPRARLCCRIRYVGHGFSRANRRARKQA